MELEKYNTLGFFQQAVIDRFYEEIKEERERRLNKEIFFKGYGIDDFINEAAWEEEWEGTEEELREALESKDRLQN